MAKSRIGVKITAPKTKGKLSLIIGLCWNVQQDLLKPVPIEVLHKQCKAELLAYLLRSGKKPDEYGLMPCTIKMPCGRGFTYRDIEYIPMSDVPCECGNPKHFYVKYYYTEINKETIDARPD